MGYNTGIAASGQGYNDVSGTYKYPLGTLLRVLASTCTRAIMMCGYNTASYCSLTPVITYYLFVPGVSLVETQYMLVMSTQATGSCR